MEWVLVHVPPSCPGSLEDIPVLWGSGYPQPAHPSVEEKKEKTLERIISAQGKVRGEISELKDKLQLAKETISKFKEEIAKLQNNPASSILSGM
ncbi:unnamed protein product, partial [Brenthis ino]